MYLILEPQDEVPSGIMYIFYIILNYALIYYGLVIGSIIAIIFTLINLKLFKNLKYYAFFTRLATLIGITIIVGFIHYILEKVVDII